MLEPLETKIHQLGSDRMLIELEGSISWDTYQKLDKALNEAIAAGGKFIKLDMGKVTTIHSCAFGPIIEAMVALENQGGSIGFRNVRDSARRVFEILDTMEIRKER